MTQIEQAAQPAILTPCPISLEGQRFETLNVGETVTQFLERVAADTRPEHWEVRINGVLVPHEIMDRVRPKPGALVEARGIVKKQVLAIVALAILAYFTMGAGVGAAGGLSAMSGLAVGSAGPAVLGAVNFPPEVSP